MDKPRQVLPVRALGVIAILGMVLLGSSIYFGVNYAVERAVVADAQAKAQQWSDYFLKAMYNVDDLIATGRLDPEQARIVQTAEKLGDVFRFKLYDATARTVLVSDDLTMRGQGTEEEAVDFNAEAAEAIEQGVSAIEIQDGTGKANRPPLYVEAYVPIPGLGGLPRGALEVYLDQTGTAALFRNTFAALAVGLAIVAALAFGLPTLAFLLRSRQASEARKRAEFLAQYDTMTGLLNRAAFTAKLESALRQAKADRQQRTVIFLDVDDFKAINDAHGHAAGDAFLKHVARAIEGPLGRNEACGRPGGDEFIVLLCGRPQAEVVGYIEAIMSAIREPISADGRAIAGRVSAGVYMVERGASLEDAMHRADVALYQAKTDGRNAHRLFTPEMEEAMTTRRALEAQVRAATETKSFEIYFQPLLDARTRRCAGFEALLRLPDGSGGMIAPSVFIPIAEQMGLIAEIGAWVLEEATRIAASWPPELFVAVNLSVKQFAGGKLVDQVNGALQASGLKPSQLELEITESVLIENSEGVGAQLRSLKGLGVSIAMDDFGTGYSSLGYLWQFGFDKLKIDRSFVTALESNDLKAREILDTIIVLGHKLDMTVTAEGIETDHQASVLSSLSADHFQGYLYGKPAPASELAAFILKNQQLPDSNTLSEATRASA
ncbi:MAG: bifunctional diguanylate cyclase/phosphodiesterase [Devosia sp.]